MDKILAILRRDIKEYMEANKLNTSTLRKHKIHGVSHATIYKILKVEDFKPAWDTIKDLLDGFGYEYVEVPYSLTLTNIIEFEEA